MDMTQRPGAKTSEFWGMLACFVLVILNGTPWIDIPGEYITMCFGLTAAYGGQRTYLKRGQQTLPEMQRVGDITVSRNMSADEWEQHTGRMGNDTVYDRHAPPAPPAGRQFADERGPTTS